MLSPKNHPTPPARKNCLHILPLSDVLVEDLLGLGVHLHHQALVGDPEPVQDPDTPQAGVGITELTEPECLKIHRCNYIL